MATIINQTFAGTYDTTASKSSLLTRFLSWSKDQERNRLLWVGLVLAGHGCIITPLTIMAVLLAGTNLFLFILALVAMGAALVTNLAAMPTKITIPVFVLSIIIDLAIIVACISMGMDITKTYI
jgi:hypothetical protein